MAQMVHGEWVTGSRFDLPRAGRKATHKRAENGLTLCGRPAARLHALTNTTAPNGTSLVDCTVCERRMAEGQS